MRIPLLAWRFKCVYKLEKTGLLVLSYKTRDINIFREVADPNQT